MAKFDDLIQKLRKPGERFDEMDILGVRLFQKPDDFCFGTDAILLSEFAKIKPNTSVVDLGTGTGIIPLIIANRRNPEHVLGIEIREDMADMAARSVKLCGLNDLITIKTMDLKDAPKEIGYGVFDHAICNPPYYKSGSGASSLHQGRRIAREDANCSLNDVCKSAFAILKNKGKLSIILPSSRLAEAFFALCSNRLEPKRVQFVHPKRDTLPNLVLIESIKLGNPSLTYDPALIMYDDDGQYTKHMLSIYRGEE